MGMFMTETGACATLPWPCAGKPVNCTHAGAPVLHSSITTTIYTTATSTARSGSSNDASICLKVNHPLLQLHIPNVSQPSNPLYIMDIIDWLHTAWRLRSQFISPKKRLDFGGFLITSHAIRSEKDKLGLTDADLDPSNKQNYVGTLKVCSCATSQGYQGCCLPLKCPHHMVAALARHASFLNPRLRAKEDYSFAMRQCRTLRRRSYIYFCGTPPPRKLGFTYRTATFTSRHEDFHGCF